MKKIAAVLTLSLLAIGTVHAQGRNFGVGLVLGDPTGFTAKYWSSATTALDFAIGWSGYFGRHGYYDPACEDGSYRRDHWDYCHGYYYDYRDRYVNGWDILHVHADYLFHNFGIIRSREKFPLFYGPGIAFNYYDYSFLQFGARGNFGIAWMPRRTPMDLFLEIAPVLYIFPGPRFDVDAGLGGRFYF